MQNIKQGRWNRQHDRAADFGRCAVYITVLQAVKSHTFSIIPHITASWQRAACARLANPARDRAAGFRMPLAQF